VSYKGKREVRYVPERTACVGIECARAQLHEFKKGSPVDTQNVTHQKVIGRSITAPPPVSSPSSIFPSHLFQRGFIPAGKSC
jgi:hypothetical protein